MQIKLHQNKEISPHLYIPTGPIPTQPWDHTDEEPLVGDRAGDEKTSSLLALEGILMDDGRPVHIFPHLKPPIRCFGKQLSSRSRHRYFQNYDKES